jgi:hypothetical protein
MKLTWSDTSSNSTRPAKTNSLVIRLYEKAGNVIERHEHAGDSKEP